MNYRHHFHAGNFADVVKHVLLVRLVQSLQQKPKGFLYLDTHAGRGSYDLTTAAAGDSLARLPEWPDGIGRLTASHDVPAEIADYLKLVREFDQSRGNRGDAVRFYPGSPWLVRMLVRADDRLALCEKHSDEFAALRAEFEKPAPPSHSPTVSVHDMDGYVAVRAMLPPAERRALILIDPPYEEQTEYAQITVALAEGLRRFPSGVFAIWYPLTQRARVQEFLSGIVALEPPPTLTAEVAVASDDSLRKLKGCGLAVINPPWKFDAEAARIVDYLGRVLAQEPGGGGRVSWLVPER